MSKKPTKLIGLSLPDFKNLVRNGEEFHFQTARLIPFYEPGDEMALTSIFMPALRFLDSSSHLRLFHYKKNKLVKRKNC